MTEGWLLQKVIPLVHQFSIYMYVETILVKRSTTIGMEMTAKLPLMEVGRYLLLDFGL
jgi:hypothetical protein